MATWSSIPGRSTLTATSRPSCSRARWTTAIDARPIGSSSKWAKVSSIGPPRLSSMTLRIFSMGTGAPVSRHDRNSWATDSPNIDGAEPTSWPNFMNVPPSSSNVRRRGAANSSSGTRRCRAVFQISDAKLRVATRKIWVARRERRARLGVGSRRGKTVGRANPSASSVTSSAMGRAYGVRPP